MLRYPLKDGPPIKPNRARNDQNGSKRALSGPESGVRDDVFECLQACKHVMTIANRNLSGNANHAWIGEVRHEPHQRVAAKSRVGINAKNKFAARVRKAKIKRAPFS